MKSESDQSDQEPVPTNLPDPASKQTEAPSEAPAQHHPASKFSGRIVVVDDDPDITVIIKDILESAQYEVFVSNYSDEGLRLIGRVCPDVVVLDIDMPGFSGTEIFGSMRSTYPQLKTTPVVFVSGRVRADQEAAMTAKGIKGGCRFLAKPFVPGRLLEAIDLFFQEKEDAKIRAAEKEAERQLQEAAKEEARQREAQAAAQESQ